MSVKSQHLPAIKAAISDAFGKEPKVNGSDRLDNNFDEVFAVIQEPITSGQLNIMNETLAKNKIPNEVEFRRSGSGIKVCVK